MKTYSSWERLSRSKVLYTAVWWHESRNYLPALIIECSPNLEREDRDVFNCTIITYSGKIGTVKRVSRFISENIEQLLIDITIKYE